MFCLSFNCNSQHSVGGRANLYASEDLAVFRGIAPIYSYKLMELVDVTANLSFFLPSVTDESYMAEPRQNNSNLEDVWVNSKSIRNLFDVGVSVRRYFPGSEKLRFSWFVGGGIGATYHSWKLESDPIDTDLYSTNWWLNKRLGKALVPRVTIEPGFEFGLNKGLLCISLQNLAPVNRFNAYAIEEGI